MTAILLPEPNGRLYVAHPPGAKVVYEIDWTDSLGVGETIASSDWAVYPASDDGVTLTNTTTLVGNVAQVTADGGTLGVDHLLVNTITKADGQLDKRTLTLRCRWV